MGFVQVGKLRAELVLGDVGSVGMKDITVAWRKLTLVHALQFMR